MRMDTRILIFGNGYTGSAIARAARDAAMPVSVTSRDPHGSGVIAFAEAGEAIARATHIVATVPPGLGGDPVLAAYAAAVRSAPLLRWVGYLSTTGVYGDRGGAWVNEASAVAPGSDRARRRVAAEEEWRAACGSVALDLFRVAGIYGPGRSAFDDLRAGRARRTHKPGHLFGRIHRDDIVGAVMAAIGQVTAGERPPGTRVLHLADDLPAESADVVTEAAGLLGIEPPPMQEFSELAPEMSNMALSFWAEDRKVSSRATQATLGRAWTYPTYREGLRGILAEEREHGPSEQG